MRPAIRRCSIAFVVSVSSVLAACGGDPAPLSLDDYRSRNAAVVCERVWSCCDAETRMRFLAGSGMSPTASEAECVERFTSLQQPTFDAVELSLSEDTVVYDGALAARCIERFEQYSCDELASVLGAVDASPAECTTIFRGVTGAGEPCSTSVQCESRFCEVSVGTCRALASEGEPCAGAICETGLFCDPAGEPPVCVRSRAEGEACSSPLECSSFTCEGGVCARPAPICVVE